MSDSPSVPDTKETSSLETAAAPVDPMQMMSSLMAGLGGMPPRALPSPNNINKTITIDLKDIYNGITKELEIERRVIQDEPTEEPETETETEANFKIETKKVTVTIEKGHYKDTIVFKGEGHQLTEDEVGDLIVTIEVNEHEYYDRDDNDLIMKKEVSLNDALCGFTFKIKDINDNELIVTTDKIIDVEPMGLVGKGLPDIDSDSSGSSEYGNIVILFDVIFPETLDKETKEALRKLLPDSVTLETSEEDKDKVLTLEDVEYETESETETETESDDEERMGTPMPTPPPGCATQ
jgi:DnaJ-class molecular chaperone